MLKYLLSVEELAGLIDAPDDDELTAFGRAVERGCMKFVKVLLKADADVHAAVSEEMGTVLHLAVERAQTEVLAYLLDLNLFDEVIDEKNAEGDTALMLAVRMGNIKCFDLLQSAGASLSARSETMGTVLHVACDVEHVEMLTHLLQFAAIRSEINTTDEFKGTVLHFAATSKPEILQLILNTDAACINSQNNVGYVPLMRALKSGSKANVEALVKAGTDLSLRDRDGLTCLHHAASRGKPEMLRVLLQANSSNINAQDRVCSAIRLPWKYYCDCVCCCLSSLFIIFAAWSHRADARLLLSACNRTWRRTQNDHQASARGRGRYLPAK
eukprot:m.468191 g.468191  ORF g.468191 m.468191 type:complete len:328 (+) comp57070_c0_seq20:800-1783(+)